jgi:hypothetical protein
MTMTRLAGIAIGAAALFAYEHEARACGGYFQPPPPPTEVETVVSGHRMVFSTSPRQSVLWDQIQYSGNPSDFAWVLPVTPGAQIQLSQDAWMAALDAATAPVVTGPTSSCGSPATGGVGCGSSEEGVSAAGGSASGDAGSGGGVTVVSQQVIGPYQAVTVRASQGEALDTWLNANGYVVPTGIAPILMAYANEGMDFIALKLRPGEGVQAMQPVRIVTQGADATLPLRMVAAGVGTNVAIELYVISGGRYAAQNFPQATVDFSQLAWDPYQNDSNFSTLTLQALSAGAGDGWITEFSGPLMYDQLGAENPGLNETYASLCRVQGSPGTFPIGDDDAGDDSPTDAGPDDADAPDTSLPPMYFAGCDDLSVAEVGLGGAPWVTRLRADLPVGALATDLILGASSSQLPVSNAHATAVYTDPNYEPCPSNGATTSGNDGCACDAARSRTDGGAWLLSGLTVLGLSALLRRRRR